MYLPGKESDSKICESCAGSLLQAGRQQKKGFQIGKHSKHITSLYLFWEYLESELGCITTEKEAVRFGLCHDTAMI